SRPDPLVSPPPPAATAATPHPRPSSETCVEDGSCTTSMSSSKEASAEQGLVGACVSPGSSRRGRCRSPPSSPRGRPASPVCHRRRGSRSRSRSPSPRRLALARPSGSSSSSSSSPSKRRGRAADAAAAAAAVCSSPVPMINCNFPKAKTEDDLDGSTVSATPPLTPLQVTPPGSRARSSGVSPTSRSPPPPAGNVVDCSARATRSEPHGGFFKDDDESTEATTTTTTTTTTMTEGRSSNVASAPLHPLPRAKQRSCRDKTKTGFYGLLSRNARG
ncbi:unnamed protein product, partial [Laminaria digitata]